MPTIPLYQADAGVDAWHRIQSPGGYEWWRFVIEGVRRDMRITAVLFTGGMFDPGYLRAYRRYRRWPSMFAPPVPMGRCGVSVTIDEADRPSRRWIIFQKQNDFDASADHLKIGQNVLTIGGDGYKLKLDNLDSEFTFRSALPRASEDRVIAACDYHWVVSAPHCEVEWGIFRGRGYYDHGWGTAPVVQRMQRWFSGQMLFAHSTCAFQVAWCRGSENPEVAMVEDDATGRQWIAPAASEVRWSRMGLWRLNCPLEFSLSDALELKNPQLIESSICRARLIYEATFKGRAGRAMCEVVDPDRIHLGL